MSNVLISEELLSGILSGLRERDDAFEGNSLYLRLCNEIEKQKGKDSQYLIQLIGTSDRKEMYNKSLVDFRRALDRLGENELHIKDSDTYSRVKWAIKEVLHDKVHEIELEEYFKKLTGNPNYRFNN